MFVPIVLGLYILAPHHYYVIHKEEEQEITNLPPHTQNTNTHARANKGRLGKTEQGMANPVEAKLRPQVSVPLVCSHVYALTRTRTHPLTLTREGYGYGLQQF